jgi:hypothetical protein
MQFMPENVSMPASFRSALQTRAGESGAPLVGNSTRAAAVSNSATLGASALMWEWNAKWTSGALGPSSYLLLSR